MDVYELAYWLDCVSSPFVMIDGYLFFKPSAATIEELTEKIKSNESVERAQYWMNIVLLEGFISAACGDEWESSDSSVQSILDTVSRIWTTQIRRDFPDVVFEIHPWIDDEYGDFGLRLSSTRKGG